MGAIERVDYTAHLTSREWAVMRRWKIEEAGYRCQLCNAGGKGVELNAHHRTYERLGRERREDLIVLCNECHEKHHDILPVPPLGVAQSVPAKDPVFAPDWGDDAAQVESIDRRMREAYAAGDLALAQLLEQKRQIAARHKAKENMSPIAETTVIERFAKKGPDVA